MSEVYNARQVAARAGRTWQPAILIEPRAWYNPDLKSINFFVPGLYALILLAFPPLLSALTVVHEQERGSIQQISISAMTVPLSVGQASQTAGTDAKAVVTVDVLTLRAGPGTNYARLGHVRRADQLEIVGENPEDTWIRIAAPDAEPYPPNGAGVYGPPPF